jgi:hypothetical protein
MRSLARLGVATVLTLFVIVGLLAAIDVVMRADIPEGTASVGAGIAAQPVEPAPPEAAERPCRATVQPGEEIATVVAAQPIDAVVCLARGVHRPFAVSRSVSAGVVVRGEGQDATFIVASQRDGVTVTNAERFTLANLTVRGGSPAGVYAAGARGLALRAVRIQGAAFGVHVDDGSTVLLEDVALMASSDFGLLVRRRSAVTGDRVRVLESRAIAVGVVENATGLTLRGSEIGRADLPGPAEGLVAVGVEHLILEDTVFRGGNPAAVYTARVPRVEARRVEIQNAVFGFHADDGASATLEDVTLTGGTGVGLLLQRGASVTGDRVRVLETTGTGISAINNAAALTLRDSEIGGTQAAGLFAGIAGCAGLPPASLSVPECFYADLPAFISTTRIELERVSVHDTQGPGVVLFPGVQAAVREAQIDRCEFTGLFAWGATVDISASSFDDNAEHGIEYRAYPDPRDPAAVLVTGGGTLIETTVQNTRPLRPGGLGGGVLAQGSSLVVVESAVLGNAAIGISYQSGATGDVTNARILNNRGIGLCLAPSTSVAVRNTTITGNAVNGVNACGGFGG